MFSFKTYQEQALLTNKAEYEAEYNRKHAGYGLVTEIGEIVDAFKRQEFYKKPLDLVNLKEEVGDALWYVAIGYHGLNQCMDVVDDVFEKGTVVSSEVQVEWLLKKLIHHASNVLNYYDEADLVSIDYDLRKIVTFLHYLALHYSFTLEEACALNIEKLRKRFPNGFTEYDAINRNKVEEMSHFVKQQEEAGTEQSQERSEVLETEASTGRDTNEVEQSDESN